MFLVGFPLLLIPVAIFNIAVFLMPGLSMTAPITTVMLPSRAEWSVTTADILLALGIFLLLIEAGKGVRPGGKYVADHLLSILLCAAVIAEFLLLPAFGNSSFFPFTVLTVVDVLTGLTLAARLRRYRARPAATQPSPLPSADAEGEAAREQAEPKF